jgi:4'-phosphopantetheinyl transferase
MSPSSAAALDARTVHVWMAHPDRLLAAAPGHASWLSPAERARATRYRDPEDGARYRATRVLIRGILAGVVGRRPGTLDFVENAHGRPSLRAPVAGGLDFNVSRSPAWAVLAVNAGAACGIDVEDLSRGNDIASIARRFAPSERALLERVPEAERRRTFFALWTLKEAFLKALGTGLTLPLGAAAFTLEPGQPPRATFGPALAEDPAAWSFAQLMPDAGHLAAVAVRSGQPPTLVVHGEVETCETVAAAR